MNIHIKELEIDMDVKNNGVTFAIADTKGKHIGNLNINKSAVIYCSGKTQKENGIKIKWEDFIKMLEGL